MVFGGEALDLGRLASWYERRGESGPTLVNMYGITETTVHVTTCLWARRSVLPVRGVASVRGSRTCGCTCWTRVCARCRWVSRVSCTSRVPVWHVAT
ncbi:protein of unknown function [Streptomyces murinus]